MAEALYGPGASVLEVRRLAGGLDGSTLAVHISPGGWVVTKRSFSAEHSWLAGEFARLQVAEAVSVPTPRPLALDADGAWFGHPALVMTRLEGHSHFHDGVGPWIDQMASAMVAIHQVVLPADPPVFLRAPHAGLAWQAPEPVALRRTARVESLIEVALSLQSDLRQVSTDGVLLHHDFHHGNLLWRRGRLVGVLDWSEATIGPAECDVGYCSVDLAMTHGVEAAQRFTSPNQAASGQGYQDLARWQALWTANAMRWVGEWISSFEDTGTNQITLPILRWRLRDFADYLLSGM
jgi:aminoglycoside phosphotransferase (APT) family kinase protein